MYVKFFSKYNQIGMSDYTYIFPLENGLPKKELNQICANVLENDLIKKDIPKKDYSLYESCGFWEYSSEDEYLRSLNPNAFKAY